MKRKLLRILPFLLLGGVLGLAAAPAAFEAAGVKAEDSNVIEVSGSVFDGQGDSPSGKSCSYTTKGITISTPNGYGTGGCLRVYGSKTLKIVSKDYNISKVELTMPDSSYRGLDSVYDNIDSTTFSKTTSKQTRISNFKITLSTSDVLLSSISVDSSKATTSFTKGQTLDLTGLKVNGTKVGGGTVDVTSQCTFSPAAGTKLDTVGSTTVNVTYAGSNTPATETGEDLTASYSVTVSEGPAQVVYTKVTSNSGLAVGDKVILVDTAKKNAAKKGLKAADNAGKHYLDIASVTIDGNNASFDADSDVCVFELAAGNIVNTFALKNEDNKYLAPYSTSAEGLKYVDSVNDAASWTLNVEHLSNLTIKTNLASATNNYLTVSNSDFRLKPSSTGNGRIDIFKYSSGNERVTLDASTKEVYEKYTTTISATAVEFEPTSWAWESSNTEFVSIFGSTNTATITVKGEAPGSSNLTVTANGKYKATCVVTCKSAGSLVIEPGSYFITDLTNKYMMGSDLSNVDDVSISQPQNLYTFEFAGLGDGTYWVSNAEGKYLAFRQNVIPDGKRVSEMTLTDEKIDYWTITKNANNQYKVATQYGTKTKSITQDGDHDWLAFDGDNYVNLTKQGTLKEFRVGHEPQYKKYYVGEKFKTNGLIVYAVYMVDGTEFLADVTTKIVWNELEAGTVATGTYSIGDDAYEVRVHGLSILGPVVGSMQVTGLRDTYLIGEMPKETVEEVKVTYSDGSNEEIKTLTDADIIVSPDKISSTTTEVEVSMKDFPEVKFTKEITAEHAKYFATNMIEIGDKVTLGTTVGAKDGNITGGHEIAIVDGELKSQTFGYLPTPAMEFEVVQGVSAGSYAFKYGNSYLTSNGKTLDFGHITKIPAIHEDDGTWTFDYPYMFEGWDEPFYVTFTEDEAGSDTWTGYGYEYKGGDYQIQGEAIRVENEMLIDLDVYLPPATSVTRHETIECTCEMNGALVIYLPSEQGVNTKNSFTCNYVESQNDWVDDYWEICPLDEPTKHIYLNTDSGKFGVSDKADYDIMLFRDMTRDFSHKIKSLSVSIPEDMPDTVELGEPYNWVGITVKAIYDNTTKKLPLGAYEVDVPSTDTYGPKTCTVTYGTSGNKVSATFTITVVGGYQPFIKQNYTELWVDDTYTFTTTSEPPVGQPVSWSSSNPDIASFADPLVGDLEAHKAGKVKVTVTSYDGYYKDTKEFTVSQRPTGMSFDIHEGEIKVGETLTITPTVTPADAKNKTVLFSSADENIAYVDSKGVVYGVNPGTTLITGITQGKGTGEEAGYTDTCSITVKEAPKVDVTSVTLDCDYKELDLTNYKTFNLVATVNPSNATIKNVTWSSNHENIATVDKNGKVTAKAKGECVITVTTVDGGKTASCTIKVKETAQPVPVQSISLDATKKAIEINETFVLAATISPGDASTKQVSFEVSDDSIATLQQTSATTVKVTGLKTGIVTITASCGGKSASCEVTVGHPVAVTSVELDKTEEKITIGDTIQLNAKVNPNDAYNKDVTWSSSNNKVATVDANGNVKGIAAGEAWITVKTADGGKTAKCHITVVDGKMSTDSIIILAAVAGGIVVIGTGCGVGIPLGIKASKKRKLAKK